MRRDTTIDDPGVRAIRSCGLPERFFMDGHIGLIPARIWAGQFLHHGQRLCAEKPWCM